MSGNPRRFASAFVALLFLMEISAPPVARSQNAPPPPPRQQAPSAPRRNGFRFKVNTNLVLVNVVVRDLHQAFFGM